VTGRGAAPGGTDLVVVGDCNPDVLVLGGDVTPSFGQQEKLVDGIWMVVGGSAAITAVAAARLGLSVELVAAVGADPAGDFMLGQLAREGVGTAAVAVRDGVPTGMTVALSHGADRAILTSLGAVASLTAQDVPAALLARARHVHVSSYFLLERSLGPGLAAMLAAARAAGAATSLDTNWDPAGRWGDGRLRSALAQTGVLLPNEPEAVRIAGEPALSAAAAALTPVGPPGAGSPVRGRSGVAPGGAAAGDARRYHGRGRLLQRRADHRPAARPHPARRGRARLCRWRAVHPGGRRHREQPRPGLRPGPGRDRHRPEGQGRSSAFSGSRPPFIRPVKISAAAVSG
jgi:sugar/nucleoside kinase (ribokinase family)